MPINPITGLEEEIDPLTGAPVVGPAKPDVNAYIKQKFNLGEYSNENRQKLVDENSGYDTTGAISGALASLAAGFQGGNSMDAANKVMNQRRDMKNQRVSEFDKGRQNTIQDMTLERDAEKNAQDEEKRLRESDPKSMESQLAQQLSSKMGFKGDPASITASKFKDFSPALMKMYEIEEKNLDRKEARNERRFQQGLKVDEKRERYDEQDLQKLSKDVEGTQSLVGALDEVEAALGGRVDEFTTEGGLKKSGKKVDLPGVSIPGMGRTSFYSEKARDLNSAAAKVFNTTLKDRSGGTVTDNEMERLKKEFSEGKFNTEEELIKGLQRFKRQVSTVLKNREAAYNPRVVSKYTDQGGRTSQTVPTGSAKTVVKTQTNAKTGEKRTVYSDGTVEITKSVAGGK